MSLNINIDESPVRPNARPATPTSKRGTITFIAEIEERGRPDIFRNLTRGVDDTVDSSPTPPVTGTSVDVSLDTIPVSLEILSLGFKGVNTPLNLTTVSSTLTVSADFASSDNSLRRDLGNVFTTLTASADFLTTNNFRKDLGNVSTTLTVSADFLSLANVRKDLGRVDVSLEASSLSIGADTNLGNVFTTLSASSISLADRVALGNVSSTLTVSADFLATANQREALGLVEINLEASGLSLSTDVGSLERVDTTLEANVLSLNTDLIFSLPDNMETPPDVDP